MQPNILPIEKDILPEFISHNSLLDYSKQHTNSGSDSSPKSDINSDNQTLAAVIQADQSKPLSNNLDQSEGSVEAGCSSYKRCASSTEVTDSLTPKRGKGTKNKTKSKHDKDGTGDTGRSWGEITHGFNFLSSYDHKEIKRLLPDLHPEVTTKHSASCGLTVDYIFYTGG